MKDMSQEQLSTLFKEPVAGTKVLPIGVVNAVPGVLPVAHAPTLRDAESHICHLKRCDQPKPRTVAKGMESATLAKGGRSYLISEGYSTEVEIITQAEAWLLLGRAAHTTLPIP